MPMKTIEGYSKEKYTNTSVLLAGGGAKALSDFIGSLSWDSTNKKIKYTPVGGSTIDLVTLSWDNIANKPTSLPANGGNADTSNRTKFLETFQQNSTTTTYGAQYPIWAQWSDSTNVRLKCTNYTVWTDKADNAINADKLDGQHGSRYTSALGGSNYVTFTVEGDANTYYPVVITNTSDYYPMQLVNISRAYFETAPDTWNTSTHRGGLTLTLLWNGSRYWDGNTSGSACYCVYHTESYSTMVGGLGNSTGGKVVWLRGGGAVYHIHSMNGTSTTVTVYTSTYTDSASQSFAPKTSPEEITVRWPGYANGADYASSAGSVAWGNVTEKPSTFEPSSHDHDTLYPKKDGIGAYGTWGIDITGSAGRLSLTSCYNGTTNNDLWSTIKSSNSSYLGTATIYEVYNDGGPDTYGEVLDIISVHNNHWQPQLWFGSGKSGRLRYRNKEYNDNSWGDWRTVAWTSDIPTNNNQLTNGAGYITGITKKMITDALGYTPPTTNTTYNFSGASFTSGNSDNGEHNANNITSNGHWYYSSNGPSTSLGASTADGALYSQAYSTSWVGQIAQDYRNGNLFTRGKNNGTWTDWKAVSYAGHTHSYLPLSGGTLTGTLGKSNNYIFKPNGGDFRTITNNYTGAICISLPANIGNTMLSMWIDVYNYTTNTSFSVHVGGYTYNSTFSNSPFAMVYGALHKVRLTYDNGFKIYIGEIDSMWNYPQISIRDVVLGFNQNYSNWSNDWNVSFVTSFPTINREITRYAITTDNIGDQSVNHATSATHADNIFLRDDSANLEYRLSFGKYNSSYVSLYSSQYLTYNPYTGRLKLKGSKEHNSVNHGGSISFGDGDYLYMKEAKDDMLLQHYKGLISDTQPIAIGFVGSCPSNSSASLVYKKSQPSAITANCTRSSSGRFVVSISNYSGKPIIAHLQVTPVRNYSQYEFAFAYIEDFTMDTADGGMEIASGTTGYFYVRTGRIHCQSSWNAGDYVATGDTGGFTGVVYAMINESLTTMPSTSW